MIDSFENRVRFMQKNYELSESRATRLIRGEDKRRKTLYQKLGKTDYDDPFLYHLVLNMSKLTLKEAKQIVCKRINP